MALKWLKRINETGRATFVLLSEWLQYIVGYTSIDINPAPSWLYGSGADAYFVDANPQLVTVSVAMPFTGAHVGKYILLYGATNERNNGLFKIVAVPSTTQLLVSGGVYGANFTAEIAVNWRLIDQDALIASGVQQCVYQAPAVGSGSVPAWQVLLQLPAAASQNIEVSVQPLGAWNAGTHTSFLGFVTYVHTADTTPRWYFSADSTSLLGWSENNAGNAVHSMFYAGSILPFSPDVDLGPVIQWGGNITTFLTAGQHLAVDNVTRIASKSIRLADPVTADYWFTSLPSDPLDLRNAGMGIVMGSDAVGYEEVRGVLRHFAEISSTHAYKAFVSNNRRLLSLGGGIGITYNGDLVV